MPALAMGEEAPTWQVRCLHGSTGHDPVTGARIVSKVGHDPMSAGGFIGWQFAIRARKAAFEARRRNAVRAEVPMSQTSKRHAG